MIQQSNERFSVFAHLSAQRSEDYRSILEVFAERRREFVIHLRPSEIAAAGGLTEEELSPLLDQLHAWGNLDRGKDYVDATSIEEFYRVKWLYQLSERGEAAERALEVFDAALGQPGELQTVALREIVEYLEAIHRLLMETEGGTPDFGKLHQQFTHLDQRFDEFTSQAQQFMRSLLGTIELHGLTQEAFLDYKEHLIDYLERFVQELVVSAHEIEQQIRAVEKAGLHSRWTDLARQARADALMPDSPEELAAEIKQREGRWEGLRQWFLGDADGRSQAEVLRARTREAIPALLVALQSFHDRRETGSDRQRDWRRLAQWFAETPDDGAAHRLWRVAFALTPARHLRINEESMARREQIDEGPRTSWLDAEPMWLEPQLRKSGRGPGAGRPPPVVDLSQERELLQRLAAEENAQIQRAHERLVRIDPMLLSDFEVLDPYAFRLLLDLLGRAASEAAFSESENSVIVRSSDGALEIELAASPVSASMATLNTSEGILTGPNYQVAIRSTAGAPEEVAV